MDPGMWPPGGAGAWWVVMTSPARGGVMSRHPLVFSRTRFSTPAGFHMVNFETIERYFTWYSLKILKHGSFTWLNLETNEPWTRWIQLWKSSNCNPAGFFTWNFKNLETRVFTWFERYFLWLISNFQNVEHFYRAAFPNCLIILNI